MKNRTTGYTRCTEGRIIPGMKAKTATVVLTGLLFSMIGVAWSQNSNTAGNTNSMSNALPRNRATGGRGRDVGPANKNPYKPGPDTNVNSVNGMVYHPEYANSANAWYPAGNSQTEFDPAYSNVMANTPANAAPPRLMRKPRRPSKKPRKISGTPTVSKILSAALTSGFAR